MGVIVHVSSKCLNTTYNVKSFPECLSHALGHFARFCHCILQKIPEQPKCIIKNRSETSSYVLKTCVQRHNALKH